MSNLIGAIRAELGTCPDLDIVDVQRVAEILQVAFPDIHPHELALEVAKVAVEQGCRYFVWEPSTLD